MSRALLIAGLAGMVIGALDPLEGSVIVLAGAGSAALAAFLDNGRRRALLYGAFGLVAFGVAALFLLSAWGGFGGNSGRSNWWGLFILPFPVGWVTGLVGAVRMFRHMRARSLSRPAAPQS
ncbi:MAG: hypothetical protein ACRD44_12185 [Bryobacteraceae bacterium]